MKNNKKKKIWKNEFFKIKNWRYNYLFGKNDKRNEKYLFMTNFIKKIKMSEKNIFKFKKYK